jgi:hypothetical protein
MKKNLAKVGGTCSILVAVSYMVVGAAFLLTPPEQVNQGTVKFMASFPQSPLPWSIVMWAFALGGLFGFGAVPAISALVEDEHEGWLSWTSGLALLGFGVTSLAFFWMIATTPLRVAAFHAGDETAKAAIVASESLIFLDIQGWFRFGCLGLWALALGVAGLRNRRISKGLAALSVAGAILFGITLAGEASCNMTLVSIGAGLGGCVAAPIMFVWFGLVLVRLKA